MGKLPLVVQRAWIVETQVDQAFVNGRRLGTKEQREADQRLYDVQQHRLEAAEAVLDNLIEGGHIAPARWDAWKRLKEEQ